MKKTLSLFSFITSLVILNVFTSSAQTVAELIEMEWVGQSVQDADFTTSGKCYLTQKMNLYVNSDNSVRGTGVTKLNLDGTIYTTTVRITGTLYDSDFQVYIKDTETISADRLPNDLRWCKGWGTLTLYKDKDKPGHYLLRGTITDDCGGSNFTEFSDD